MTYFESELFSVLKPKSEGKYILLGVSDIGKAS